MNMKITDQGKYVSWILPWFSNQGIFPCISILHVKYFERGREKRRLEFFVLKGLGHEIEFKHFDKNG